VNIKQEVLLLSRTFKNVIVKAVTEIKFNFKEIFCEFLIDVDHMITVL
jgi:hypothetical protein